MTSFRTTIDIAARPEDVWAVIADLAHVADWDSGVISVDGTLAVGETLKLRSEVDPKRTFKLKVTELDAPRRTVWSGGMPLGLFRGVRTYALESTGDGTRFTMREDYGGPLLGLIARSLPDLQPSFDRYAAGLAAEVARRAAD